MWLTYESLFSLPCLIVSNSGGKMLLRGDSMLVLFNVFGSSLNNKNIVDFLFEFYYKMHLNTLNNFDRSVYDRKSTIFWWIQWNFSLMLILFIRLYTIFDICLFDV